MAADRTLDFHGGAFAPLHRELVGAEIDLGTLATERMPQALLAQARAEWQERVRTEYRSVQMMNRLLGDALAAGDPFDAHAGIVELISDELRHVHLCAAVVRALGATPLLPDPIEVQQPQAFERMQPAQRALAVAIAVLVVNETLSVGFIRDLHARCKQPAIFAVLDATLADESEHDAFGVEYVRRALARQPAAMIAQWRKVADDALRPQRELAAAVLRELAPERRTLAAFPDEREVALGLFSRERQALVFERTYAERLAPCLRELGLL
jgi:hypothetical protein